MNQRYVVIGVVLLIVFYFFFWRDARAVTMQNDTESIALPASVNDQGVQAPIYDDPFLIETWAQGSNDPYEEYLATLTASLTPDASGTVVITVADDGEAGNSEAFISAFSEVSGFSYTPPPRRLGAGRGAGSSSRALSFDRRSPRRASSPLR